MSGERPFVIEPLGQQHDRAPFRCGSDALDRYLRQQASQEQRRGFAAVYVLVDRSKDNAVCGFYTLSAASLQAVELPADIARKLPRYQEVPAILLGRLAIHLDWQDQRLGRLLLTDALLRCTALKDIAAAFLVEDAKDEAAAGFYAHRGFRALPDQPLRLYLALPELRQQLAQAAQQ